MLYVILREIDDRLMLRELRGFEGAIERYYENKRTCALNVSVYEETQFTWHNQRKQRQELLYRGKKLRNF